MRHKPYDHYITVLTIEEGMRIANLIASLGIALEGLTLVVPEGDDEMFRIEPRQLREAHRIMMDALENRWLGTND